ncbi:MAG: CPBP family intramembrane metalloprotease [Acidobacteria bacterium]|nr:CPBP family intramembrane metalloprotease [Acidobacteriota bacterium]
MAEDRLQAKDLKVLLLWIVIGLAGAGVAFKYFFRAFPEAAVDFRVSRPAALEVARNFLTAQGQKLEGYQSSIVFRVDDNAKTYLEREVGLEQANRLMASEVSVWYWNVRFFRPGQKEEYKVRVSPAGRVVGMTHTIEEARAGARLNKETAFPIALTFLRERLRVNYGNYNLLQEEANSTERPNRRDWSFTWERAGFKAKDAPYRVRVTLQGDQIGGSEEFLKVPEAWERDYQRLRSSNLLYEYIALVPYGLLYGALFWVLYDLGRRGMLRWSGALKVAALVAVLFFVNSANAWPLARSNYDTNSSYPGFFASQMVQAALVSLLAGLSVAVALAGAEPLYRRSQPDQLRLNAMFRLPGIRSKEFFRSCVIGLTMAAGHIGFIVLFYLIGGKFGVWAPQEVNYTDVVSTTLPWIFPLTIGVFAATSEEFLFRLFAIPLLLRLTRSRFLAIVLPAFAWGFLHSSYPQEPGYIRGIEVGLIGIVAGVVMLRWGILATLVWHYTVDALLISLFLLRSASLYFRISGALVGAGVLIPLAVAGAFYLSRRRFEADESLLNRGEPLVETVAPPAAAAAAPPSRAGYEALTAGNLGIVLAWGVVGAVLLVAVKAHTIGDFVRFKINAREAAAQADDVLRKNKIDLARFRRVATTDDSFNEYANEYLRRQVGTDGANRLYQEKVPSAFWRVRYFRDAQKEEYAVVLRADGALHSVHHQLEEKAPGASLTKEEAQARAESHLREEKKLDLAKWKLVEATSDKRPARTDHTLTWEELEAIGEAHVRTEIKVQGDEVSGYRVFLKIPEEWERRQKKTTLASSIHFVARIVFYVALAIVVLVIFFMNLKQQRVPWRRLARWALWGLLATLITTGSSLPELLSKYPTEFPFKTYAAILVITVFLIVAATYSALFFLFGLAWFFLARVFGEERLPSWTGMPAAYYRDAFWVALAGSGALLGLARLPFLLARIWPTARKGLEASLPTGFDAYLPAAQVIGGAVSSGLFMAGLVALAAGFIAGYLRQSWMQFGLVLLLAVVRASDWGSPADFAKKVLFQLIAVGIAWWGVTRLVRFNLLAYFLLAACVTLAGAAAQLLQQPNEFFRVNGIAVVAAAVALLAWPLVGWRRAAA